MGKARTHNGSSTPTIRDVARAAELSVASVSRVLNRHDNVHPETRDKVHRAMRDLGYVPNAAARSLSTAKANAIGVVLPDLYGEYFGELVRGIDRAVGKHGKLLLLSTIHADLALAASAMGAMRGRTDGLIVMAPELSRADLDTVIPAGMPTVLINSPEDAAHFNLRVDNRAGMMLMVRHLLARGCRSIIHLGGRPENLDAAERTEGFRMAMADLAPDLAADVLQGDFSEESGERLVQQLLSKGSRFDAIFAANDMMALGAIQALKTVGISVPDEVAVAGFDDIPLARHLGLTTLAVNIAATGAMAVERLMIELAGEAPAPQLVRTSARLVVRESTSRR